MQITSHHRNILSVLPPEIVVQILSYTDARTVGRVSASSSSCKALIDENSQIIYEAIAIRHFLTPCTAGDSGITIESLPAFAREELDQNDVIAPVERHLQKAIKYQRTSSTAYDNIATWRDFVRKRTLVDRAWKHGRPSRYTAASCPTYGTLNSGLWRFKICSYSRRVFGSTPVMPIGNMDSGVLFSAQRAPALQGIHDVLKQTRGWTHVEYSNGYLIYIDRRTIEVNALDPAPELNAAYPGNCKLIHKHSISPPTPLMSYKARYPYLHALSRTEGKSYLFDLEAGRLVREFDLMTDPEPSYVELDQWSLFLAGSTLTVIDRKNGSKHDLLVPDFDDQHDIWTTRFTAVHHSLDGRHLLAAGDANELVWIRNYRDILTSTGTGVDQEVLRKNAVILRLESDAGEVMVENLCVENDRVIFTTQSTFYPVVYLFELRDWSNFNDFKGHAPQIRILSGGLPTGADGISRVEMDSTCVYLTGSTREEFKDTPGFEDVHPSDLEFAWYKLDGTRLCNAHVKPTWPPSSPSQKYDMRDFDTQHRIFLNDAVLCYDFSSLYDDAETVDEESESMFTSLHSPEYSNDERQDMETSHNPEGDDEANQVESERGNGRGYRQ